MYARPPCPISRVPLLQPNDVKTRAAMPHKVCERQVVKEEEEHHIGRERSRDHDPRGPC